MLVETNRAGVGCFSGNVASVASAGVSMTMGMTMTLDRNTDQRLDLETIWAEVGASIERFVRRRVNDPHQADDVVAEVMLRIHQNLGTLDDHERVTAWVFRIARNAITDHYRRNGRRREVLAAELEPRRRPERRRLARRPGGHPVGARVLHPATRRGPARRLSAGARTHRLRRSQPGRRRADRRHLAVGHEVAGAARPTPVRHARQAVLRRHHRQPRRARRLPAARRRLRLPAPSRELLPLTDLHCSSAHSSTIVDHR